MDKEILFAVKRSLQTHPTVKPNDVVVLGKVKSFYNGHLTHDLLVQEINEYIEQHFFILGNDEKLRVTELGILKLGLNS